MENIFQWLTDNKSKLMNKFILNMIPNKRDAEDFYQDLYIIMAEKDLNKMTRIHEAGEMEQYLYIIIRNNLRSSNSRYYYTYRKPLGFEYSENEDVRYEVDNTEKYKILEELELEYEGLLKKINRHLDDQLIEKPKSFYDKKVFEMYYNEDNTFRGLSKMLGIPSTSIYNTITRSRTKILDLFKEEVKNINNKLIYYYSL